MGAVNVCGVLGGPDQRELQFLDCEDIIAIYGFNHIGEIYADTCRIQNGILEVSSNGISVKCSVLLYNQ